MKGFDPEFQDLDHYIRVITDRIWEGRRLDDIRRYYSEDCAVETPSSVSIGIEPVIEGTRKTLSAFPDRRLLAEDVIISGDAEDGFLSSHRIFSPMTHAGPGAFGLPTGRAVHVRTVADCVCLNNRIIHEWLVRDQAAIARAIGRHEREVAQEWLDAAGGWAKPPMPPAPAPYRTRIESEGPAADMAQAWMDSLRGDPARQTAVAASVIAALPGATAAVGLEARGRFWSELLGALPSPAIEIEHLVSVPRPGRATAVAMRWRWRAEHAGGGRYGQPSGRPVEILGITHAEIEDGQLVREWVLIDEVATWMQLLTPRNA
jgi:predicted ester cyclase